MGALLYFSHSMCMRRNHAVCLRSFDGRFMYRGFGGTCIVNEGGGGSTTILTYMRNVPGVLP